MTTLGLSLRLKIRRFGESYNITDAADRHVASVYFEGDPERRGVMRRMEPEQALEVAKTIARAVTERVEAERAGHEKPAADRSGRVRTADR